MLAEKHLAAVRNALILGPIKPKEAFESLVRLADSLEKDRDRQLEIITLLRAQVIRLHNTIDQTETV